MNMRVLCLTTWFPNEPRGREGNYIHDSVMSLREQGINVSVLLCRAWKPWQRNVPNYQLFPKDLSLEMVHYLSIPRDYLRSKSNRMLFSGLYRKVMTYAQHHNVQLIHAHTESLAEVASSVASALQIKSVVTIHGINTSRRYLGTSEQKGYFRKALNACDRVVLVGEPLREYFASITGRDDHFRVVHNGFKLLEANVNRVICVEPVKRLISVSNLHEGKGIDLTIKALAQLNGAGIKDWTYNIVGDGYLRAELEHLVQTFALQNQITFVGAVEHKDVARYLNQADLFVLPSYREAFGIAYLEAMACGLLTIGVEGQGAAEFIHHRKNGLLVKAKDVKDLTHQIQSAMENLEDSQKMAKAGQKTAILDFNWARHAASLCTVYRELLQEREAF